MCIDTEMRDWVQECLKQTRALNERRPMASRVHREVVNAFGKSRAPGSDSSTRKHLKDHEPVWQSWNETDVR